MNFQPYCANGPYLDKQSKRINTFRYKALQSGICILATAVFLLVSKANEEERRVVISVLIRGVLEILFENKGSVFINHWFLSFFD